MRGLPLDGAAATRRRPPGRRAPVPATPATACRPDPVSARVSARRAGSLVADAQYLAELDLVALQVVPLAQLGHADGVPLGDRRQRVALDPLVGGAGLVGARTEEHTSELQSLIRISQAVYCLKPKQTVPS